MSDLVLTVNSESFDVVNDVSTVAITDDLSINDSLIVDAISSINGYGYDTSIANVDDSIVIGETDNKKMKVYICEKWQSTDPIDLGDGLYASLPEDMLSDSDLKKKVYNKLEELYPEKVIKLGMNEDNLSLRKKSVTIEIDLKGK